MTIDKQRLEAVKTLRALGFSFAGGMWSAPANDKHRAMLVEAEADMLHAKLVFRADALEGCAEGSQEEQELEAITDAIESYEAVRWPAGKIPGGKG